MILHTYSDVSHHGVLPAQIRLYVTRETCSLGRLYYHFAVSIHLEWHQSCILGLLEGRTMIDTKMASSTKESYEAGDKYRKESYESKIHMWRESSLFFNLNRSESVHINNLTLWRKLWKCFYSHLFTLQATREHFFKTYWKECLFTSIKNTTHRHVIINGKCKIQK